jgi:hypothetical protein
MIMTKGERKKAIALALARIEAADIALDEAYRRFYEKEAELDKVEFVVYGAYLAEIRPYRECVEMWQAEWHRAKHEYAELTKCKAWKNL